MAASIQTDVAEWLEAGRHEYHTNPHGPDNGECESTLASQVGRANTLAVMRNAYAQYLWDDNMSSTCLFTEASTNTPTLQAMAAWASMTLETMLARFERDYGEVLTWNNKLPIHGDHLPIRWDFVRPPQTKEYMERLIQVQRDRLEKSASRLPSLPTDHHASGPYLAAMENEQIRAKSHELRTLEVFWKGTRSLMKRVDEWLEESETAPHAIDHGTKRRPDVDDDDNLRKQSRMGGPVSTANPYNCGM
jgi:hypothetical protein